MRTVLVIGWIVGFSIALAFALVTRRRAAWAWLVILAVPAVWIWFGVRYGTG